MGLVEPPWVGKKYFKSAPFNYCDHFGNEEELSLMCKICKDDIAWREKLKKVGRNPNSWEEVFKEVEKNFALATAMIQKQAEEMGIDLSDAKNEPNPREIQPRRYRVYRIVEKYGNRVEQVVKGLEFVPMDVNIDLLKRAIDVFFHSRFYAQVKIHRALASRKEEKDDEIAQELADSKTSALLVCLAVERNSRAFFHLANQKPLLYHRKEFLKLSRVSREMAELIQSEFYPEDKFEIKEFGCDSYNKIFKEIPGVPT